MTANRHDVELTWIDGKRVLRLDGEKVKGVRSVNVTLAYNDVPHVVIDLVPASFRYVGFGPTKLDGSQEMVEEV